MESLCGSDLEGLMSLEFLVKLSIVPVDVASHEVNHVSLVSTLLVVCVYGMHVRFLLNRA